MKFLQRNDFLGFLFIGFSTVVINLATFWLCIEAGFPIYISVAAGNFLSTVLYFLGLSKVFRREVHLYSIVRFLASVIAYYFASLAVLYGFNLFSENVLISRVATFAVVTPLNYVVQKHFVFK
jgi:putative flippase GtrA